MNFNEKTTRKNFNDLLRYLMEPKTSHFEIKRILPNYASDPEYFFQIIIHCPQADVDSEFISREFNLTVRKFTEIWDNGRVYIPGIYPYDKELEHSYIWADIIDYTEK